MGALSKPVKLNENSDFRRAYGRGKSYAGATVVTYVLKNRTSCLRYGITTSKKVGNAVERNRCRRVIRAAFDAVYPQITVNCDLVFVARSRTKYVKSTVIRDEMLKQLKIAGVIE